MRRTDCDTTQRLAHLMCKQVGIADWKSHPFRNKKYRYCHPNSHGIKSIWTRTLCRWKSHNRHVRRIGLSILFRYYDPAVVSASLSMSISQRRSNEYNFFGISIARGVLMLRTCRLDHLCVCVCPESVLWQNGWLDPDAVWGGEWSWGSYGCIIIDFPNLGLTYNGGWCSATKTRWNS